MTTKVARAIHCCCATDAERFLVMWESGGGGEGSNNYHFTFAGKAFRCICTCDAATQSAMRSISGVCFEYNTDCVYRNAQHHTISHLLAFSIIIASLLFFIGRFLICLFRDIYLHFRNWLLFKSAQCFELNAKWHFTSHRRERERRRLFSLVLERSKWCSNNWTEGIKHYYSQLWFGHTLRERSGGGGHRIEIYTTISKSTRICRLSRVCRRGSIHSPSSSFVQNHLPSTEDICHPLPFISSKLANGNDGLIATATLRAHLNVILY